MKRKRNFPSQAANPNPHPIQCSVQVDEAAHHDRQRTRMILRSPSRSDEWPSATNTLDTQYLIDVSLPIREARNEFGGCAENSFAGAGKRVHVSGGYS